MAGTLSTLLTPTELLKVTNLILTGKIDARDVKTMRDNMPLLSVLDMAEVSILVMKVSQQSRGDRMVIPAQMDGVYLVKAGGYPFKVMF